MVNKWMNATELMFCDVTHLYFIAVNAQRIEKHIMTDVLPERINYFLEKKIFPN